MVHFVRLAGYSRKVTLNKPYGLGIIGLKPSVDMCMVLSFLVIQRVGLQYPKNLLFQGLDPLIEGS